MCGNLFHAGTMQTTRCIFAHFLGYMLTLNVITRIATSTITDKRLSWDISEAYSTQEMLAHNHTMVCFYRLGGWDPDLTLSTSNDPNLCNTICECKECESCNLQGRYFKGVIKGGLSKYLLLLVSDSKGTKFVAKLGNHPKGHQEAKHAPFVRPIMGIRNACGFSDIVPEEKHVNIQVILTSKTGERRIRASNVVLSEYRPGKPWSKSLSAKVNQSQIVRAAWFDYLIAVGDHFEGNILVSETSLTLIDNQAHSLSSMPNGLFIPGKF